MSAISERIAIGTLSGRQNSGLAHTLVLSGRLGYRPYWSRYDHGGRRAVDSAVIDTSARCSASPVDEKARMTISD